MRLSQKYLAMLPLAALALSAAPAAASEGAAASSAAMALALTPTAVLTIQPPRPFAPAPQASKALKAGMRLTALSCAPAQLAAPAGMLSQSAIILKGAPSKLEQMKLAQAGQSPSAPAPAAAEPFNPAAQAAPCPSALSAIKSALRRPAPDALTAALPAAIPTDPTAEFGSRPMRVTRTRFDDDWARATRDPARGTLTATLRSAGISAAAGEAELFKAVNNWANRNIGYADDIVQYHRADHWATAAETIANGRGDCEDYAILKMQMLRAAGFDADRMKLVLLRDLTGGGDHAVLLVVSAEGQRLVLDNNTDRIYDGSRGDYLRPVYSYGTAGRFIHGVDARPVMAAASPTPTVAPAPVRVALNQRSVSAEPLAFKIGFKR
jgi:predicted transglutaminase-like cysteine proteinase